MLKNVLIVFLCIITLMFWSVSIDLSNNSLEQLERKANSQIFEPLGVPWPPPGEG